MDELVECHSGFTYADRPVALTWEGQRLEIVEIPAQWRSPDERHFRVRTSNGQEFELSYHDSADEHRTEHPGTTGRTSGTSGKLTNFKETGCRKILMRTISHSVWPV